MRKWIDLCERKDDLGLQKRILYADDPEFDRVIPRVIQHWPDGLMGLYQGDYYKLRLKVPIVIEDVPHRLMVTGQARVTHAGVKHYMDNPSTELPEVDLWQGRYIIQDGHHRIVADILRGSPTTRCQVRDMNTLYNWEGYLRGEDDDEGTWDWKSELVRRV